MKTELKITGDGSHTLFVPGLNEHYHSTFGAIGESMHVFIESGLKEILKSGEDIHLIEVGFGTGLNALLTWMEAESHARKIFYTAIEPYPVEEAIWSALNYPETFCTFSYRKIFNRIHEAEWERTEQISPFFTLKKIKTTFKDFEPGTSAFNMVYFDAFGPDVQPELWSEENFKKIHTAMKPGGILMTYSVKGAVRRALKECGFAVEKIPGPAGKREITRAIK
jgi:tRNA U34 5-methylaminomethyl-2-thiouridine-forming methyltransferase MnmC